MKRIKREQYFNDPSYDKRTSELITEIYQIVLEIRAEISKSDQSSVCLVNGVLYLFDSGDWEVRNAEEGTKMVPYFEDIEVALGYYFAPSDDQDPESYFFRMKPDIQRTQACQYFFRLLEIALDKYEVL